MTKRRSTPTPKPAPPSGDQIVVTEQPGKSRERQLAEVALNPAASAAATIRGFSKGTFGDSNLTSLLDVLLDRAAEVRRGDLRSAETMLVAQAATLDALFLELTRRSGLNMGEYFDAAMRYMGMALKAQAQCRATLEALAAIKNPPVVYARQANIAAGPQQVNNGVEPPIPSPAGKRNENPPNKLLEDRHDEAQRLDLGTPGAPGAGDPALAPVGRVDGAAHG